MPSCRTAFCSKLIVDRLAVDDKDSLFWDRDLEAEGKVSASGIAASRLLMLTGCRRNETLTLRGEVVDLEA